MAYCPASASRDACEPRLRIHGDGMADGFKHREIGEGIAVGVAFREGKAVSCGECVESYRFFRAAHVLASDAPGPEHVASFELRGEI